MSKPARGSIAAELTAWISQTRGKRLCDIAPETKPLSLARYSLLPAFRAARTRLKQYPDTLLLPDQLEQRPAQEKAHTDKPKPNPMLVDDTKGFG
jgi:hypothetical protein